jgi:hypothetical protein
MADLFKMVEIGQIYPRAVNFFGQKQVLKKFDSRKDILVKKTKKKHAWQKI